jgi:hypothetical protein
VRKLLVVAVVFALFGVACQEETKSPDAGLPALKEGDEAPGFTLESTEAEISLADYRGERPVLLYFSMGPG